MISEQKACIVPRPYQRRQGQRFDCGPKKFREEIKEKVRKLKESGIGEFQSDVYCFFPICLEGKEYAWGTYGSVISATNRTHTHSSS
jgi:hypothetical protein